MMDAILNNKKFQSDYAKLKDVTLNPARHTASNAYEHCRRVRERVVALSTLNGCSEEKVRILETLAVVHDIGKVQGCSHPAKSVELLTQYGSFDDEFINLVKFHDINLPWYQSMKKGQLPGDKAWHRLSKKVDMKLLCIFMVADRVDCPGGWKSNAPLVWFLEQCKQRNLINTELILNEGPNEPLPEGCIIEYSAGGILIDKYRTNRALIIRVRDRGYEIPKGHIEKNETREEAALRELREETGILSQVEVIGRIGTIEYTFRRRGSRVRKNVTYYLMAPANGDALQFAPLPKETKELRWIGKEDLSEISFVNDELRDLIELAFIQER